MPPVEIRSISPSKWQGGARESDSPRRSQMLGIRNVMEPRALGASSPALLSTSPRSISPLRVSTTTSPQRASVAGTAMSASEGEGESKRTKVAKELLSSERVYVNNLRLIVNTVLQPAKSGAKGGPPADSVKVRAPPPSNTLTRPSRPLRVSMRSSSISRAFWR